MPNYRIQVQLPWVSGLPEDLTVNTWSMQANSDAALSGVYTALENFYAAVDRLFSNIIDNTADACLMTAYDYADPEPRVPVSTNTFTVDPSSGVSLPPEIALCLSFQGDRLSGVNQARRRGRIFLGPLTASYDDGTVAMLETDGRPVDSAVDIIRDAGQTLLDASDADANWTWIVHSEVSGQHADVTNGWCDDEWDVQRRRGRLATARLTFS